VAPANPTVLVQADSTVAIKRNDILVRLTDNAVTIVNGVGSKGLTVQQPFAAWTKDQAVGLAPRSTAVAVKETASDASKSTITLNTATHNITAPSMVVGLNDQKKPTGAVANVTGVTGDTLEIKPPLTEAALAAIKQVALIRKDVTIRDIQPR